MKINKPKTAEQEALFSGKDKEPEDTYYAMTGLDGRFKAHIWHKTAVLIF